MYKYPEDKNSIEFKLQRPFDENDLEYRPAQAGISNGIPWVRALTYVDARAVQQRLDECFGFQNWHTEIKQVNGGFICKLSVFYDGKWIHKEDGSDESDIESFKGGISGAFKRVAASGYGIGRYLYSLTEAFSECSLDKKKGWRFAEDKVTRQKIYWMPQKLPSWALPNQKKTIHSKAVEQKPNLSDYVFKEGYFQGEKLSDIKDFDRLESYYQIIKSKNAPKDLLDAIAVRLMELDLSNS